MPDHRTSTESHGLGQSGYTAGRRSEDLSLVTEIEATNIAYPRGLDEHILELGDDDRWTGRGGLPWDDEGESRVPPALPRERSRA
jgi:hypothetical protein